jgi:crossover junction endodeoxyribonuclease RuvC
MVTLGIDPGLSGALAWVEDGRVMDIADLPILNEGPRRKSIDPVELSALLKRYHVSRAVIEAVHARPTDGKAAAFTFGRNFGVLEAVVMAHGVPLIRVPPVTWRRWAGLPPAAPKEASIAAAMRLAPSARHCLTRHDRADAVLMALWGAQHG